jgi:hypothetical protein
MRPSGIIGTSRALKTHKVQIFASAATKIEISCFATTPIRDFLTRINQEL